MRKRKDLPSIKLARKGRIFGRASGIHRREILWEYILSEYVGTNDNEGTSVREPCDDVRQGRVV
jgi:hypothetical protein